MARVRVLESMPVFKRCVGSCGRYCEFAVVDVEN